MKTVKPPRKPEDAPTVDVQCRNEDCAALLRCTKNDVSYAGDQRDPSLYRMCCPHCHRDTYFDWNDTYFDWKRSRQS